MTTNLINALAAVLAISTASVAADLTQINKCLATDPFNNIEPYPFKRSIALNAISQFCANGKGTGDYSIYQPSNGTATEKATGIWTEIGTCGSDINRRLTEDDCKLSLQSAMDNCDLNTVTAKLGNIMNVTGDDGYCVQWSIHADTFSDSK